MPGQWPGRDFTSYSIGQGHHNPTGGHTSHLHMGGTHSGTLSWFDLKWTRHDLQADRRSEFASSSDEVSSIRQICDPRKVRVQ